MVRINPIFGEVIREYDVKQHKLQNHQLSPAISQVFSFYVNQNSQSIILCDMYTTGFICSKNNDQFKFYKFNMVLVKSPSILFYSILFSVICAFLELQT